MKNTNLLEIIKVLKKYVKESKDYSMGITYYTGDLVQDMKNELSEKEEKIFRKEMSKLTTDLHFFMRKRPDNVGGYHYVAYPRAEGEGMFGQRNLDETQEWISLK
tara:strand:- start:292 stop:606 length:315 start_codon:yes stop_codon:yes gene_type:complete